MGPDLQQVVGRLAEVVHGGLRVTGERAEQVDAVAGRGSVDLRGLRGAVLAEQVEGATAIALDTVGEHQRCRGVLPTVGRAGGLGEALEGAGALLCAGQAVAFDGVHQQVSTARAAASWTSASVSPAEKQAL